MKLFLCLFASLVIITSCGNTSQKTGQKPKTVENKKEQKEKLLGEFETVVLDKDEDRVQNLVLSAQAIDGMVINPGETFSFNDSVGRRTKEKGYEEARIIVGCEQDYAVGGGVCQVSSTLFNAAEFAGMEIVERHSHSKDIHYVETGRDAAISYGTLDLRFKNTRDKKVKIAVSTDGNKVYASLWEVN